MTLYMAAPPYAPIPPVANVATNEKKSLQLDFTPVIGGGTIVAATTTLTDLTVGRGTVIEGLASPTVDSPIVTQYVPGSLLSVAHVYELEYLATLDADDVLLSVLTIRCLR